MDREEYAKHIGQINEGAFVSLLLSLGHELGLFDLMMKENRPLTSHELADIAEMKERYVREWLKGVAVAKMVSMDQENDTFFIPEEHHGVLKSGQLTIGAIQLFSGRFEALKNCFKKDGPFSFGAFKDNFWSWYSADRNLILDGMLEKTIQGYKEGGIYDKLESGVEVLDICCGSGEFITKLALRFPKSTFTGIDLEQVAIDGAQNLIALHELSNCSVLKGSVLDLPSSMNERFDIITMEDALHDLPDPNKGLTQISKALKPDGTFAISDFSMSGNTGEYIGNLTVGLYLTCSLFVCLPSGMSAEPRAGHGVFWGRKNILSEVNKHFVVENSFEVGPLTMLDLCKKK